jgi:hypothetical protein
MDTSTLLTQTFNFYKAPATLTDADGNTRSIEAVVWSAELGLGRNVSMPLQTTGHSEQKVSHYAIVGTKPLDDEEKLEATFNHVASRFRLEAPPEGIGTHTPVVWLLKMNKEAI